MDEIHVHEEEDELWEIERNSGTYKLGHAAGLERGIERGRRMTLIELILTVLDVRGLALDADAKARIHSCEALATLERWAQRAPEVGCAAELFEPS